MTVVSGPPGSGKTVLLRSWVGAAGLTERAAWVPAGRDERDPQRFWLSVLGALRKTTPGSALVQPLTAAPDLDGWAIVEQLLADLAPLADRIWLVIDDVHELSPGALRQLELLVMRAPPGLRFVLATRHDVRLGLHRLRLEGELAEIREPDLRFTSAGCSSWRAEGTPTRSPRSGAPSRWPGGSPPRTTPSLGHGRCWYTSWCAWAIPRAPSRPLPNSAAKTASTGRRASLPRCCGSPKTTRTRRSPRSRRSSTASPPYSRGLGLLTLSSWRRLPGTRSATRAPPAGPWNARSTSSSPTARSRCSCCTPRRACSSAMPGTAPPTPF